MASAAASYPLWMRIRCQRDDTFCSQPIGTMSAATQDQEEPRGKQGLVYLAGNKAFLASYFSLLLRLAIQSCRGGVSKYKNSGGSLLVAGLRSNLFQTPSTSLQAHRNFCCPTLPRPHPHSPQRPLRPQSAPVPQTVPTAAMEARLCVDQVRFIPVHNWWL